MVQQLYKIYLYKGSYCYNQIYKSSKEEVIDLIHVISKLCKLYEIDDITIEIYIVVAIQTLMKAEL